MTAGSLCIALEKVLADSKHQFHLLRSLRGSVTVYMLGALLVFSMHLLLARLMGAAEYGIYYYAFTWLLAAAMLSQFGLDQAVVRFMPGYAGKRDWPKAKGILKFGERLIGLLGLAVGVLMVLGTVAIGDQMGVSQKETFLIAALCLPLRGLIYLRQAALRSFMFTIRSLLPDAVVVPIIIIVLAVGAERMSYKPNAPAVMCFTLVALLVSFIVGAYWQSRLLPNELRDAKPQYEYRVWTRMAIVLLFINGAHLLLSSIDLMILGMYGSPAEVGIYGISSRLASMVTFILVAAYPVFAPLIARHHAKPAKLQFDITRGMRLIAIAALVVSAFLIIFGGEFLGLFGNEFRQGHAVLGILVAGQLVNALCGPVALLLAYNGEELLVAKVLTVSALLSAGLSLVLIPRFGMQGAALGTAVSVAFWNLILYVMVRKRLQIDSSGWLPCTCKIV